MPPRDCYRTHVVQLSADMVHLAHEAYVFIDLLISDKLDLLPYQLYIAEPWIFLGDCIEKAKGRCGLPVFLLCCRNIDSQRLIFHQFENHTMKKSYNKE